MKKATILIFLIVTISYMGLAQDNAKIMNLIDQVAKKTEQYSSLKIDFNMFIENLQNKKRDKYSGKAIYKKGNYKLDIMEQIVFSDGKTNWTYLKDAEEINITNNTNNEAVMLNPQQLLKDYKSKFKIKYIADKFESNRPLVEIDFIPITIENKKYSKITLKIDKTKKQIYSIRYIGKDGINYLIEINKLVENPVIQDAEIKYSKDLFPDAEVIDMR